MTQRPGNGAIAHDFEKENPTQNEYLDYLKEKKSQEQKPQSTAGSEFIFADEKMLRIKEIVKQIADANVPVLITGESGTGKEVIAKMIHRYSQRSKDPFVAINCAALPPSLLESELFGFEKGSFTGANQTHKGKFEQADGGTLLLDEITETDQNLQAKLLRALQENEIERIGANGPIKINNRVIATTNRDIAATVSEGKFRQDLFYRLYVIHLEIPPLRERKKDVEVLTRHFLKAFSSKYKDHNVSLTADAMHKLVRYPWPGNVRELQNVIQRAVLMCNSDKLVGDDFHLKPKKMLQDMDWVRHLPIGHKMREVETQFIIETLRHHNGNRTHSAKTLGISLRTLRNKINEFTVEGHTIPQPTSGKPA